MIMKRILTVFICFCSLMAFAAPAEDWLLWDNKPAKDWMHQYYPIGNGRIGAMLSGGIVQDHIQFNENTLWTGDEQETGSYQAFGDVFIDFKSQSGDVKNYKRVLNLNRSLHEVSYSRLLMKDLFV